MDKKEQWEHFAATGKVEDYLEYRGFVMGASNLTNVVPGQIPATGAIVFDDGTPDEEETDNGRYGDADRHDSYGRSY